MFMAVSEISLEFAASTVRPCRVLGRATSAVSLWWQLPPAVHPKAALTAG